MKRGIRLARRRAALIPLAWVIGQAACANESCSDAGERRLARLVEIALAEPGPIADSAAEALVAAGSPAILHVETGLYDADAAGRVRLVRILTRIGDREAAPILALLAARDPDPDVRAEAGAGARSLEAGPLP